MSFHREIPPVSPRDQHGFKKDGMSLFQKLADGMKVCAVIQNRRIKADNYGNEIMNYRYKAKSVITVTSSDVDKVRSLMRRQSELMKQGIALVSEEYSNTTVSYEFTGLNKIKPEMIEEATKNARATAQKFADDSESSLGGILSAQQGQFSIEDRDSNTPYIKRLRVVNTIEYSLK